MRTPRADPAMTSFRQSRAAPCHGLETFSLDPPFCVIARRSSGSSGRAGKGPCRPGAFITPSPHGAHRPGGTSRQGRKQSLTRTGSGLASLRYGDATPAQKRWIRAQADGRAADSTLRPAALSGGAVGIRRPTVRRSGLVRPSRASVRTTPHRPVTERAPEYARSRARTQRHTDHGRSGQKS